MRFHDRVQNADALFYKFRIGNWLDAKERVHEVHKSFDGETWSKIGGGGTFAAETQLKEGNIGLPSPAGGQTQDWSSADTLFTGVVYVRASMSGNAGNKMLVGWDQIRFGCGYNGAGTIARGCDNFLLLPAGGAGGSHASHDVHSPAHRNPHSFSGTVGAAGGGEGGWPVLHHCPPHARQPCSSFMQSSGT